MGFFSGNLEDLWSGVLAEIELEVSKPNFTTWFKNTKAVDKDSGILVVGVPNGFAKEWLSAKYSKLIVKIVRNMSPDIRGIDFSIISSVAVVETKRQEKKAVEAAPGASEQMGFEEIYIDKEANLNPKYVFDNFVVGPFNEMAYSAGMAVIKNLGTAYNPLFIYGGVGLGKTHLIQAIGNEVRKNNPNLRVFYLSSEKFAVDFMNSIQNKDTSSFKEKYRKYDLLIVDDIQFFAGKLKTQEEFFHVFNTLYGDNKQIVFSSDRPPKHIENLEDRLRSRFEGGMIIDITQPELESRMAILKAKLDQKGFSLGQPVLEYIAEAVQDNIRELEGALNSIIGQSKIKGRQLSLEEVKETIKKNLKPKKMVTINQLLKTICDFYNIKERHLFEKTRRKDIVIPRQVAMYLLRDDFESSYPFIGQKFGGKDHTTVIHAFEKISTLVKEGGRVAEEVEQIRKIIYSNQTT